MALLLTARLVQMRVEGWDLFSKNFCKEESRNRRKGLICLRLIFSLISFFIILYFHLNQSSNLGLFFPRYKDIYQYILLSK
ncbi:hypothetical protein VNO78_35176 [Psophocarpus tetragonolobus]|uniref:Uncharacterized protein n=1 Tax=Psophocarpus tetragonolobus TaxID=3891 RepID=A0AAN9NU44_PSOTE